MNTGFQYFPEKLYSSPVKIVNVKTLTFFGMSKPQEAFYSIKDGNWSDATVWETVSGRIGKIPSFTDDVYVRHNITVDSTSSYCNNLFVKGSLTFPDHMIVWVKGFIKSTGNVGVINNADLLNKSNVAVAGNIDPVSIIDLGNYGAIIGGSCFLNNVSGYQFIKNNEGGNILFIGKVTRFNPGIISINTSTPVEFRGGIKNGSVGSSFFGSGICSFTTNDQLLEASANLNIYLGTCIIRNIILTIEVACPVYVDNINGISSDSLLVNKGTLYIQKIDLIMTIGSFDYLTYANSIGYIFDGNFTLPYTAYFGIIIGGTGTKKFSGATSFLGDLTVNSGATLDLESYDLTVPGVTTAIGSLTRTGSGIAVFVGILYIGNGVTFSLAGECRGGISGFSSSSVTVNSAITFTTNNQNIDATNVNVPATITFNGSLLISGAITVTGGNHLPTFSTMNFSQQINGNNAGSTFVNKINGGTSRPLNYQAAAQPMATGVLDCNSYANIWRYNKAGAQDVKGTTYRILEFGGSGVKTLQGNVVVNTTAGGSWSITGTASINYNGYTITTI